MILGVRGAKALCTAIYWMGVYFADTGYQNALKHGRSAHSCPLVFARKHSTHIPICVNASARLREMSHARVLPNACLCLCETRAPCRFTHRRVRAHARLRHKDKKVRATTESNVCSSFGGSARPARLAAEHVGRACAAARACGFCASLPERLRANVTPTVARALLVPN